MVSKMNKKTFTQLVEEYMIKANVTQAQAAKDIGTSASMINRIINKGHVPNKIKAKTIEETIKQKLKELEPEPKKPNKMLPRWKEDRFILIKENGSDLVITLGGPYKKFVEEMLFRIDGVNRGYMPREELVEWLKKKID